MRFTVEISLKGKSPFLLPTNYRRNIISLIKEAFISYERGHEIYFKYWGDYNENRLKPFTFSLYIPNPRLIILDDAGFLQFDDQILKLHISSSDSDFLYTLYNGLLNINKSYTLFKHPIEFNNFRFKRDDVIDSDTVRFKIMSPIVVRNIFTKGYNKRCMGYLTHYDSHFKDSLAHSIRNMCKRFLCGWKKIKWNDIEIDTSYCSSIRVYHYWEVIPATKGVIGIKANKDVLRLIYDAGIGARRSQGFGMVKIANVHSPSFFIKKEELFAKN